MRTRLSLASMCFSVTAVVIVAAFATRSIEAQPPIAKDAPPAGAAEPTPPANQTYIGVTKCASCHFDKYSDWRKQQEKHAKAFDILPAASKADPNCLGCHSTGFGQASGFHTEADKSLAGVTCEACHGPGSAHAEIAKPFANKKPIAPADEKLARDAIYRMLPQNVCADCHTNRSHRKHPDYPKAQ